MNDPKYVGTELPKPARWITDGGLCGHAEVQACREIIVEVRGDLDGKDVNFYGGLTLAEDMPFLAYTKNSPWIGSVKGVSFIRPVTEAVGVTITIRGIQ